MNNKVLILAVGVVSMFLIFSTVGVVGAQTETTNAVKPKQISVIADTASTVSDPAQSSGSSRGANPTRLDGIMIQPANACGRALSPIGGLFSTIFCALLPDGSYEWSRANNLLNNGDTVGIGTAPAATKLSVLAIQ